MERPMTEAQGWVVINSLRGGAAGRGTRMRAGLDRNEVESLAKTMEVKFTVAGPSIGGAKSGINFDPTDPRKSGVLQRWYKAVTPQPQWQPHRRSRHAAFRRGERHRMGSTCRYIYSCSSIAISVQRARGAVGGQRAGSHLIGRECAVCRPGDFLRTISSRAYEIALRELV